MKFLVTDFAVPQATQIGGLYFAGSFSAPVSDRDQCVSIYLDADPIGEKGKEKKSISVADVLEEIESDDFYFAAIYDKAQNMFYMQTDIVSYFGCWIYVDSNFFALSDDIHALLTALGAHVKPPISETRVREFLYFAKLPLGETVFPDISILLPASI